MQEKYMIMAKEAAQQGMRSGDGGPFGAVIVKGDKVVACSHNSVVKDNDPTAHAEINAIREACRSLNTYDLNGCELYSTGKPCPMCFSAIQWANISQVFYALSYEDASAIGFRDDGIRALIVAGDDGKMVQIQRDECLNLYAEWERRINKTMY